ncbi:MAG TPA: bifunctional phosphopantothenoylcysteine decarboxylase/phosphopantothenate--cysteine ligase CoaBC [Chitinophagaceae bacterium]
MLKGKKILLGVTGSIAAYKTAILVRLFVRAGAEVKVVMTSSAKDFVSPLTLSTLSKHPVLYNISDEDTWANHVMLGRWADVMLVAPCSANTLGKMAKGICDNLLQAVYLSATCPVVISPAMDEDMWHHPATQQNIAKLSSYGVKVIPAEHGELASGLTGEGRMPEPETLFRYLVENYFRDTRLNGMKALVTAGPTYEAIDPVRFIGNHSSGKMGIAIAEELYLNGADVELVLGPTLIQPRFTGIHTVKVQSAGQMYEAVRRSFPSADIAVMSAAVADYTPVEPSPGKIKKRSEDFNLRLKPTADILKSIGREKKPGQFVVGFALETENEEVHARDKLKTKNADLIVLNSLREEGAGFGVDTNKIIVFGSEGETWNFPLAAKTQLAREIINLIITRLQR